MWLNHYKLSTYLNPENNKEMAIYNAIKNDKEMIGSESSIIKNILFKYYFGNSEIKEEIILEKEELETSEIDNLKKKLFLDICSEM